MYVSFAQQTSWHAPRSFYFLTQLAAHEKLHSRRNMFVGLLFISFQMSQMQNMYNVPLLQDRHKICDQSMLCFLWCAFWLVNVFACAPWKSNSVIQTCNSFTTKHFQAKIHSNLTSGSIPTHQWHSLNPVVLICEFWELSLCVLWHPFAWFFHFLVLGKAARKANPSFLESYAIFSREQQHTQNKAQGDTSGQAADLVQQVEFQRNFRWEYVNSCAFECLNHHNLFRECW